MNDSQVLVDTIPLTRWEEAVALVTSASLPVADLRPGKQNFLGAYHGGILLGTIAWEPYGNVALVRSLAVREFRRGAGIGTALYQALEEEAVSRGLSQLVLLTETAEAFFLKLGYAKVNREELAEAVKASAEFQGLCPVSASAMTKRLQPNLPAK